MININKQNELINAAMKIRENAYAPYSNFQVAAALLCADGEIITGINMESSSYGLSVCAERNTIATAVAKGKKDFIAMAVVSRNGVTPCGACRQVIFDICGNIDIILGDEKGSIQDTITMKVLLPKAFSHKDLG
ncbi:MAG: cytidine deaminase [Candidatus Marinimicrobia bacterium]|nr:cytidine deaminase [Candidatus Neomarinimicrobiota bacterium]